jgi:hypothetical protein
MKHAYATLFGLSQQDYVSENQGKAHGVWLSIFTLTKP